MTKVRVYIATTEGPAEVQRITAEDENVKSVICLNCKAVSLPISDGYNAFVRRPTGIIEAIFGHSAYRLDVSLPISTGMSWQLGVLVAHALFAEGRLAEKNETAEEAIWLTGEVDRDLQVFPISHLREKIRRSAHLFQALKLSGTAVTMFGPKSNFKESYLTGRHEAEVGRGEPKIVPVTSALEVIQHLHLPSIRLEGGSAASLTIRRGTGQARAVGWSLLGFGLAGAILVAAVWGDQVAERVVGVVHKDADVASPRPLSIAALELRAFEGDSCAAVEFGAVEPEIIETALSHGKLLDTRGTDKLCRLQYKITNGAVPAKVWVFGARAGKESALLHTRTLTKSHALMEAESLSIDVRLPRRYQRELLHRLAVVVSPRAEGIQSKKLDDISGKLGPSRSVEEWETLLQDMKAAGLEVIDISHVISP